MTFKIKLLSTLGLGALLAFLCWPSPILPEGWAPPKAPPMNGILQPNHALASAERLGLGQLQAAEDVLADEKGRLYVTDHDKVLRLSQDAKPKSAIETLAHTGGQNLGLAWLNSQTLAVANQPLGLFTVNIENGQTTHLETPGIHYANAIATDSDGQTLYFSESSDRYYGETWKYLYDLLEAKPHGNLWAYHLKTGKLTRLLSGLYYANGVALSPKKDFLLVNETYRYQIRRYWLKGPKAGQADIFAENLPGFPDGLSQDSKTGNYLAAMYTVRNPAIDTLHHYPFIKSQMAKLPRFMWPQPKHYGMVLVLNPNGQIVDSLQDPGGEIFAISSARKIGSQLYLGSLHGGFAGRLNWDTSKLAAHP